MVQMCNLYFVGFCIQGGDPTGTGYGNFKSIAVIGNSIAFGQ